MDLGPAVDPGPGKTIFDLVYSTTIIKLWQLRHRRSGLVCGYVYIYIYILYIYIHT